MTSSSQDRVLELADISFRYPGGRLALEGVSLLLSAGERLAVVGPNGAGKSTLLRIVAGLARPEHGKVLLGKGIRAGFLFQDPDDQIVMPTVEEDVMFGPLNLGLPEGKARAQASRVMRLCGLEGFGDRHPSELSLGEKKRVAIAGVLAMEPDVLLLDEPTANLDPRGRAELLSVLRRTKAAAIVATHDLTAAMEIAGRALVLKRRALFDGPFRELFVNGDVLLEGNLEMPSFLKLYFALAGKGGGPGVAVPMDVEEAASILSGDR